MWFSFSFKQEIPTGYYLRHRATPSHAVTSQDRAQVKSQKKKKKEKKKKKTRKDKLKGKKEIN